MNALDVLDHPARRRIVELLAAGELSASEIAGRFDMSRPAVSQHLGVLLDGGVLHARAAGRHRLYRVDHESLREAGDWLSAQASRWQRALDALESALDDERI